MLLLPLLEAAGAAVWVVTAAGRAALNTGSNCVGFGGLALVVVVELRAPLLRTTSWAEAVVAGGACCPVPPRSGMWIATGFSGLLGRETSELTAGRPGRGRDKVF